MVQPYTMGSTKPDFRPMKKSFKDTVRSAVRRTLMSKKPNEDVDADTLADTSHVDSQCSTLIEFTVGSVESSWQASPRTAMYDLPRPTWPIVVPDPSRNDYLRMSPDVDTASIDTQTLDPEDNAWGPPRRVTAKSRRHTDIKDAKRKLFSRSGPNPKKASHATLLDADERAWM